MLDSKLKRTLRSMIIGTALYNVVLLIISVIVFLLYCKSKNMESSKAIIFITKNIVCILIGLVCSVIGLYSMALSLSKAISANDEKYAKKHVALMSTVRLVAFCIILVIVINEKTFGLVGGVMFALSTLGIKIGAYLTPIMEKKLQK